MKPQTSTPPPAVVPETPAAPVLRSIGREGVLHLEDGSQQAIPYYKDPAWMVLYLVRHCEKESGDNNPPLSAAGTARAERLGKVFDNAILDKIGASNTKRTLQTAEIVQRWAGDPGMENFPPEGSSDWLTEALDTGGGRKVLYVGHQNTVPFLLNTLTAPNRYPAIPDTAFDRLYIAVTKGVGKTEVLEFRY